MVDEDVVEDRGGKEGHGQEEEIEEDEQVHEGLPSPPGRAFPQVKGSMAPSPL